MLKREARILGLSAARKENEIIIVGIIFRGSLWLDGMVTCTVGMNDQKSNSKLSTTIIQSKQYSQLHAIIMMSACPVPGWKIALADLSCKVKLPVIAIADSRTVSASKRDQGMRAVRCFDLVVGRKRVHVLAVGIGREDAEELFNVGCSRGNRVPEAVRVAHLLAKQVSSREFLNQWGKVKIAEKHSGRKS